MIGENFEILILIFTNLLMFIEFIDTRIYYIFIEQSY